MSKGPDAFRTISEVAEELDLPQHVLRFWETRFTQIKPMKRGGGRRYYRPDDVDLLRGIRRLLYGEGYTIKGVQRILKEQGPRHVIGAGQGMGLDPTPEGDEPDEYGDDIPQDFDSDQDGGDFDDAPQDDGDRDGRREPVFSREDLDAGRRAATPSVRAPADRPQQAYHGGRIEPSSGPSRIPAAPPDLQSSAEDYRPPVTADLPLPPDRGPEPVRHDSPYAPGASARLEPAPSHPVESEWDNPAEAGQGLEDAGAPHQATRHAVAGSGLSMSKSDRERLQATLMELLECKRILDNVR